MISLLVFIILSLLHVPFAGLFGFITFVLNFIPNVSPPVIPSSPLQHPTLRDRVSMPVTMRQFGPIMATVLPLPLVVFHPGLSVQSKILAFVLPSIGHFFCGYWLVGGQAGSQGGRQPCQSPICSFYSSACLPACLLVQEPRVFGEHLELHPIIILVALAFWGVLWGVVGMILSVPLISLIKIISQHLDHPYARSTTMPPLTVASCGRSA